MYGYYTERDEGRDSSYTDLAVERHRADLSVKGIEYKREIGISGVWERIKVTTDEGAESINRPKGIYDTFETSRMDLLDSESLDDSKDEIARELCYLCDIEDVYPERILVVGLGNGNLTPDSVGVRCAELIKPTMHIKHFDEEYFNSLECSEIAVIKPGVSAETGYDSFYAVRGLCGELRPGLVIAIDSLASRSDERLGSTVQLSNTGILPGSGIGNCRYAISKETLETPVISIGVPTIIDSGLFCPTECAEQMTDLIQSNRKGMMVAPKEIGDIVKSAAEIIAGGINRAFGLFL